VHDGHLRDCLIDLSFRPTGGNRAHLLAVNLNRQSTQVGEKVRGSLDIDIPFL
jgi:hypothetical protein